MLGFDRKKKDRRRENNITFNIKQTTSCAKIKQTATCQKKIKWKEYKVEFRY